MRLGRWLQHSEIPGKIYFLTEEKATQCSFLLDDQGFFFFSFKTCQIHIDYLFNVKMMSTVM